MHRYAGHDAARLQQALRVMRSSGGTPKNVELLDTWGNTLLHSACATGGALPQVTMLLAAGAQVNAIGPYGLTPLATALMGQQWRAARLVAAAGGQLTLGPFNEPSERSFLANVFGIDGVTYLHGHAFELEGAFDFGVYPRLAEAVEAFAHTCADLSICSSSMWTQSAQALRDAASNNFLPCSTVQAKARAGTPLLLPTGWRGHSVCVAILGNQWVLADRNRWQPWSKYKALQPLCYRGALTIKQLQRLRSNRIRPPWAGKVVLMWMDATHRLGRHQSLARTCARLAPKPQQAHNCTVANGKAGLLALLTLLRERNGSIETAATCSALQTEYKKLTTFVRLYFLERYRALHAVAGAASSDPPDTALVQRCEAKLYASKKRQPMLAALRAACMGATDRC